MPTLKFLATGAIQTFTIPNSISTIVVKTWGAAGGPDFGFGSKAGAGGYSSGTLVTTGGQGLSIMVGSVGIVQSTTITFGGGGAGGVGQSFPGASGGGRSGVGFSTTLPQFIIAGGGGGAGPGATTSNNLGGNGGGINGNNQTILTGGAVLTAATGGTQVAGGAGGTNSAAPAVNGFAGSSLLGGTGGANNRASEGGGGGGGGGFFGGGGGSGANGTDLQSEQAGAGGSGFINTNILLNATTTATPQGTTLGVVLPPNTSDPDYVAGVGVANSTAGTGNGLVVLTFSDLVLNKSVDKAFAQVGDILNYTVTIRNTGPGTVSNITFVDTIPSATTFTGNVNQDGTQVPGNPSFPGVTLPNFIGENQVSTVTFSVTVTSTIPNPIRNQAIASYGNSSFSYISNQVTTTIAGAIINSSKIVNKGFSTIGDIITYSIVLKNVGVNQANNVVFLDTIPNGTSLVSGTFKQENTVIAGTPNSPGTTLPNSIAPGATSTVTFQVVVNTLPSPNPILNSASMSYSNLVGTTTTTNSSNTNTVNTQINNASLSGITKLVDKSFATCGENITYTIIATNTGNVTAQNVVFKDTIPNGTVLVSNSVFVNGVPQTGANPSTGVTIPNIAPGQTTTLTFRVQIQC